FAGSRATSRSHNVRGDVYSALRWWVTKTRTTRTSAREGADVARADVRRDAIRSARTTTRTTTAASGRYMRCSATVCVTSGTTLDVGARTTKNHAPANPSTGRRTSAHAVAPTRVPSTTAYGRTSAAAVAT